jgi:hypothetical protein
MIYRDLPIFIGPANQDITSITNYNYLMASQVSIDMNAGAVAKRKINQPINQYDQFTHPDPLSSKISFQSYIIGSDQEGFVNPDLSTAAKIILNQSTGDNYHVIKIGNNVFNKCYLNSYTVDINPLRPVILSVDFTCNNPPTGTSIAQLSNGVDSFIGSNNFAEKIIHSHTCSVSGVGNVVSDIQSSIRYQVTCARTPVYPIGSITPSSMILDQVERQMDIDSTDIHKIINQEGSTLISPISIGLKYQKNYSMTARLGMSAGSKILSQKINMQEGDTLSTQVSIKEILDPTPPPPIVDLSTDKTYAVVQSSSSMDEPGNITFNFTTTNVPSGSVLSYEMQNISTSNADFTGATSGSFTIQNNKGSFSISAKADLTTEGLETFKVVVRDAVSEKIFESSPIYIIDTSKNPIPTYLVLANATSVSEGGAVSFTITTTNVPDGTSLSYDLVNLTTTNADFTGGTSGTVVIINNTASFGMNIATDSLSELTDETFKVNIFNIGSLIVLASSQIISIDGNSQIVLPGTNWVQKGPIISSANTNGNSTCVSADGNVVVTSGKTQTQAFISVNKWNPSNSTWTNTKIYPQYKDLNMQVKISDDGNSIIFVYTTGYSFNGDYSSYAGVYVYNGANWALRGPIISLPTGGRAANINISGDGNVIAIGTPEDTSPEQVGASFRVTVKILKWSGSSWISNNISRLSVAQESFQFGACIALNYVGDVIAITTESTGSGVRIYKLIDNIWQESSGPNYSFGVPYSYDAITNGANDIIELNAKGNIIAITKYFQSSGQPDIPRIEVYKWSEAQTDWLKLGDYIPGGAEYSISDPDMSMSMDGTASRIIWSTQLAVAGNNSESSIRVIDWNGSNWVQTATIAPSPENSNNGFEISLSADGKTMALADPYNDKVTVYTTNVL